MSREHLAVAAAVLTAGCVLPYLRDIRRGVTRPQRASWLVFAVLAAVAAVSQAFEGADAGALLAGGAALGFGAVSVASIRHGEGGFAQADRIALAVAAAETVLSIVTAQPVTAVVAVMVAELGAVALTVGRRAARHNRWVPA